MILQKNLRDQQSENQRSDESYETNENRRRSGLYFVRKTDNFIETSVVHGPGFCFPFIFQLIVVGIGLVSDSLLEIIHILEIKNYFSGNKIQLRQ